MAKLTCNCGYVTDNPNHYKVEGMMWKHAMKDHRDMLTKQNADQIAGWLKNADEEMGGEMSTNNRALLRPIVSTHVSTHTHSCERL